MSALDQQLKQRAVADRDFRQNKPKNVQLFFQIMHHFISLLFTGSACWFATLKIQNTPSGTEKGEGTLQLPSTAPTPPLQPRPPLGTPLGRNSPNGRTRSCGKGKPLTQTLTKEDGKLLCTFRLINKKYLQIRLREPKSKRGV